MSMHTEYARPRIESCGILVSVDAKTVKRNGPIFTYHLGLPQVRLRLTSSLPCLRPHNTLVCILDRNMGKLSARDQAAVSYLRDALFFFLVSLLDHCVSPECRWSEYTICETSRFESLIVTRIELGAAKFS